ncbi:MAG: hypothetical protein KatS3mg012_0646 [Gaiellaceae bacterium]|nr:MAG: hypothetical protein KatS3mg012_0646 [Gaiellaceae bacterium]
MDAGTLVWILLIGGGVLAMFFMHRGGHAHGGFGGGGGCGGHGQGHDHSGTAADEPRNEDARPLAKSGSHDHGDKPVPAGSKHRGC